MLTVTVNKRHTFKSVDLSKAKQMASKIANKYAQDSDWVRIYVSSGSVTIENEIFGTGTELRMKRFNQMHPKFKPGKWLIDQVSNVTSNH